MLPVAGLGTKKPPVSRRRWSGHRGSSLFRGPLPNEKRAPVAPRHIGRMARPPDDGDGMILIQSEA